MQKPVKYDIVLYGNLKIKIVMVMYQVMKVMNTAHISYKNLNDIFFILTNKNRQYSRIVLLEYT